MLKCLPWKCPWRVWLDTVLPQLGAGQRVTAPAYLPHPRECGFTRLEIAEPAGQVDDYACSSTDGSRIHVHVFADGRLVVHRDRFDPDASPLHAAQHVMSETSFGPLLVASGIVLAIAGIAALASKPRRRRA